MENWNRLFIRQGFMLKEVKEGLFDCQGESEENISFLLESLDKLQVNYFYLLGKLKIEDAAVSEREWLRAVDFRYRGQTEMLLTAGGGVIPYLKNLDTYISGLVRQLNRLGFYTVSSCDGHDRKPATIGFVKGTDMEKVMMLLRTVGAGKVYRRENSLRLRNLRLQILELAEKLSFLDKNNIGELEEIKKQMLLCRLDSCLAIVGESRNEGLIRQYVIDEIKNYVDRLTVDSYGNILAENICGTGHGPVILLNAHLDTYCKFDEDREITKEDGIWTSTSGILGADDRAGVAVLLETVSRLPDLQFNGKVKFIFTVEEEIGLLGAENVVEHFLWDIDAAFVVDRRGSGDIVTSCGGYIKFCDERFGEWIEETALTAGLSGWRCTAGGSSDTRIWASRGVQSVNLSVGYQHEHTSNEYLDTEACFETLKLLEEILNKGRGLRRILNTPIQNLKVSI